jgi:hypothetical protein
MHLSVDSALKLELNNKKKKKQKIWKQLEAEQHIAQWPLGHPWYKRGNSKVPGSYWKWKHDLPEPMGHSKGCVP